jgi:hypothetical protein
VDLARARYLISREGRQALAALDPSLGSLDAVVLASELRRRFTSGTAAALGEQLTLRARARERFGDDGGFLYTGPGLEMITHPAVAKRRASRLATLGLPVADLTAGLGGDLRACCAAGLVCAGADTDPVTALLASANLPGVPIVLADAAHPPFRIEQMAVILDPSRRTDRARTFDPDAFSPPWEVALAVLHEARAGVLKTAPGIADVHLPPEAEVEFVQLGRTLREAALWMGAGAVPGLRRAVLLPQGLELDSTAPAAPGSPAAPGAFVFDPAPCVTRATLVLQLGHLLGASLLDRHVAYLTGPSPALHPMCATFEVMDVLPFSVGRLRTYLRGRGFAAQEIRRRAFPVEPDELRKLLGRQEGTPVALLCTTISGKRTVVVARRWAPPGAETPGIA